MSGLVEIPSWYVPRGEGGKAGQRPASCPFEDVTHTIPPGQGPDGLGGNVYGSHWHPSRGGWAQTSAGYWIRYVNALPQDMGRLHPHRALRDLREVRGYIDSHRWLVPVLIRQRGDGGAYQSALDQVWTDKGWTDDEEMRGLQTRLRAVALGIAKRQDYAGLPELGAEILSLTHSGATLPELAAAGWMSQSFLLRVLLAAAGFQTGGANGQ